MKTCIFYITYLGSYGFIAIIILLSTLLSKKGIIGSEGSRKFIHIGIANWYFLALIFIEDPNDFWWLIIPPISFVGLNYISYKKQLISSMERDGKGNLGTVYYPIALLIVLILSFEVFNNPYLGLMGAFVIGIIFITLYFIEHTFSFKLAIEWLSIITISGFIGSILDSYLGVLLQAKYKDLKSGKIAEIITNTEQFILISGKKMITNNAVNFIMVLTISLATYVFLVM